MGIANWISGVIANVKTTARTLLYHNPAVDSYEAVQGNNGAINVNVVSGGSGGGGGGGAVTAIAGAFVDGASVTEGLTTDQPADLPTTTASLTGVLRGMWTTLKAGIGITGTVASNDGGSTITGVTLPTGSGLTGWLSYIYNALATAGIKITTLPNLILSASSAVIGKVGIDQTTPGTTNGVYLVGINLVAFTGASALQNAATANGNGTAANVSALASFTFDVDPGGAAFSATVNFECSEDDINWQPIVVSKKGVSGFVPAATTTTSGYYTCIVTNQSYVRARISGYASGTITVNGYGSAQQEAEKVVLAYVQNAASSPVNVALSGSIAGVLVAGAAVDGWDLTQGVTTDAAVQGDNPGTVSAKLRGINKYFASLFNTTKNWLLVGIGGRPLIGTQVGTDITLSWAASAVVNTYQQAEIVAPSIVDQEYEVEVCNLSEEANLVANIFNTEANFGAITHGSQLYGPITVPKITPQGVWQAISATGAGVYTDETTNINSAAANDVPLPPMTALNDAIYFADTIPFRAIRLVIGTPGVYAATLVWEYWNGSAWTTVSVTDGTSGFTVSGKITFSPPADWAVASVNSSPNLYWVRCRCSAFTGKTTAPLGTQGYTYSLKNPAALSTLIHGLFAGGVNAKIAIYNDTVLDASGAFSAYIRVREVM